MRWLAVVVFCTGSWGGLRAAIRPGIDPRAMVERHDVIYTAPSPEPWQAMPTGGGDLSAMVRWDGSLRLHLTKSDAWGFQAPQDAPAGTRFFNNVSPGHIRLVFSSKAAEAAARGFRQRLDLYHGQVSVHIGPEGEAARIAVWGHPHRKVLVMEVTDPHGLLDAPVVEVVEWRPSVEVRAGGAALTAREVHTRPARPHLANTGMEDWPVDPLLGRGLGVAVGVAGVRPLAPEATGQTARFRLPARLPRAYRILAAAAVTPAGDPAGAALRELQNAASVSPGRLRAEHRAWWRAYWSRAYVHLESPAADAARLLRAYYVHLYTLACVNRGPVPAKWDGGPGLLDEDRRHWGLAEWIQEIRFTYWPLYAANQLEMARGLFSHYSRMLPYLERQTERLWGLPGLWVPETALPWGHAEDFSLRPGVPVPGHYRPWDPRQQPFGRFAAYNPYVGLLFTAGLELCHHYLTFARYSGDETFLREQAYPILKGVSEFVAALFRYDERGRAYLEPANALETWRLVRNPADTLAGVAAILPEFVRLSRAYGRDRAARERCERLLANLPDPPRGQWREDGARIADESIWAPAEDGPAQKPANRENPALYRVAPFGLSGAGAPDAAIALETFRRRIRPLSDGWSMDAIWAARLGLGEEAGRRLARHAELFQRFPYGGWTSNDSKYWPNGLSVTPFLDAGGVSATALQEMLLQSHGGLLRLLPAAPPDWSGSFQLRAEGGFLVTGDFRGGHLRAAWIRSLLGRSCRLANPWPDTAVVSTGRKEVVRAPGREIEFPTAPGKEYRLRRGNTE